MSSRKSDLLRFSLFGLAAQAVVLSVYIPWLSIAAWLMGRDRITFAERGLFSIDSEWLAIKFSEDIVVIAAVVHD